MMDRAEMFKDLSCNDAELLAELDDMEAEAACEDLMSMDCGVISMPMAAMACQSAAAPVNQSDQEDDLLAMMMSDSSYTPIIKEAKPVVVEESKNAINSVDVAKPSFESVIKLQSSSGFWASSSRAILASCIEGGQIEDTNVHKALE